MLSKGNNMIVLDRSRVKANIEKRINNDVASGRIGGASVLVKQRGKVVYKGCFGKAAEERAITENSIYRLASMTKPITAAAVMKQVERGLVSLDDNLEKFIAEYGEMEIGRVVDGKIEIVGRAQNKIKILHLLTHTSGVACGELSVALSRMMNVESEHDLESTTMVHSSNPISFEPYTAQAYSPRVGFDLLARVVEITSGMSFDEFLKKEIFEPLGMLDTTFTPTSEQWDRMVCVHNYEDCKASFEPLDRNHIFWDLPMTCFCGGAGLVSTLADYEKFADMLLSGGKARDREILLREETVRLMRTAAVPYEIMPGRQRWGLGMRVITDPAYILPVGSFGWSGAYGTHFWVDIENEIVAIYMKNSLYDGGSGAITAAEFERDVYL